MRENDIEKLAFLYVCRESDRELLLGKREMEFQDFCRLDYLSGSLGLERFNLRLWQEHAWKFQEQIGKNGVESRQEVEQGIQQRECWIWDFLEGIRDEETRELCKEVIWG